MASPASWASASSPAILVATRILSWVRAATPGAPGPLGPCPSYTDTSALALCFGCSDLVAELGRWGRNLVVDYGRRVDRVRTPDYWRFQAPNIHARIQMWVECGDGKRYCTSTSSSQISLKQFHRRNADVSLMNRDK
jgi:hypothetical protein